MISVKRFEGMLVFFKISQFWSVLKFWFRTVCGVYVAVWSNSLEHMRKLLKVSEQYNQSLAGQVSDLFQWGLQTADLRESLCWIMKARGSGVMQAYLFDLSKMGSYPGAGI